MLAFETTEYRGRVKAVSALMEERGVDVLLCLREANICYLTGYEGFSEYVPQAAILRKGDTDPILIFREMDVHCAIPTVYLDPSRIEGYPESYIGTPDRSPWEFIGNRVISIAGGGRIGIELEAPGLSVLGHRALMRVLGERPVIDVGHMVHQVRMRKSPRELQYMRQAGVIVDKAMQATIARIAVGVRQCDVGATLMSELATGTPEFGGSAPLQMPSIPMSPAASAPHLKWVDTPYVAGSQTNLEVGAFRRRYCCALSRTAYLGVPPPRLAYTHEAVLEGFNAAFGAIRPGVTCAEVHSAFTRSFSPKGIRKESRIGYSIGIDWADFAFSLQSNDHTVLDTDYTLHLIIGIWEKSDAYIFSETIRVGENGAESFSTTPRALFVR